MTEGHSDIKRIEKRISALREQRATGALEARDGKKRRIFFFDGGNLSYTYSNLKSETSESVAKRLSDPSPDDIIITQGAVRLAAILAGDDQEVLWHEGKQPPQREDLELLRVLWEALGLGLDDATLLARLMDVADGNPTHLEPGLASLDPLPVSSAIKTWLASLDGYRELREVLEFVPGERALCLRALYLANLWGMVAFKPQDDYHVVTGVGGAVGEVSFRPTAAPAAVSAQAPAADDEDEAAPGALEDDIAKLIAEGIGRGGTETDDNPETLAVKKEIARIEQAENHFQVLGTSWQSSVEDFRNAYFTLARILHPDRLVDHPDAFRQQAEAVFDRARQAWEVLKDENERQRYIDRVIHGQKSEEEEAMERVQEILTAESTFRRGMAAFLAGQVVNAHKAFEEASQLVPEEPEFKAYYGYTLYRINVGRDDEAVEKGIEMIKESLEHGKKMDGPWVLMGKVYVDRKEQKLAARCFVQALRINASNADAQRELERMKRQKESSEKKVGFLAGLFGRNKKKGGKDR